MSNKEYFIRKKKFEKIKKDNLIFKDKFNISYSIIYIRNKLCKNNLSFLNKNIKIAGRIVNRRIIGKLTFLIIQDINSYIQIYISSNFISDSIYIYQNKFLDIGDLIGVEGSIFTTKTNELSIKCKYIYLLVKCLYPLANKYSGLLDDKLKYKKRYLDLISNVKSRKTFILRSNFIKEIRNFLYKKDFIEVETPIIQDIPGGAEANPFITRHNYLKNKKLYLRIAPELYLKQLLIGGFNKIFEIGKNFRNEGLSVNHNPEFTTMEIYITYVDFKYLIKLIENMIKYICIKVIKNTNLKFKNIYIDFNKKFNVISMKNSIYYFNDNIDKNLDLNNINDCILISKKNNILIEKEWSLGKIQFEIFKKIVEKKIEHPTFITEYPIDVSPLSKRNIINNNIADRFELFICGLEIGNGFSELNDPEDQKNRFLNQKLENNSFYDKDYIESMKYGLPISSGVGIGIDRLIMILTNNYNIKDVIFFPNIRYK